MASPSASEKRIPAQELLRVVESFQRNPAVLWEYARKPDQFRLLVRDLTYYLPVGVAGKFQRSTLSKQEGEEFFKLLEGPLRSDLIHKLRRKALEEGPGISEETKSGIKILRTNVQANQSQVATTTHLEFELKGVEGGLDKKKVEVKTTPNLRGDISIVNDVVSFSPKQALKAKTSYTVTLVVDGQEVGTLTFTTADIAKQEPSTSKSPIAGGAGKGEGAEKPQPLGELHATEAGLATGISHKETQKVTLGQRVQTSLAGVGNKLPEEVKSAPKGILSRFSIFAGEKLKNAPWSRIVPAVGIGAAVAATAGPAAGAVGVGVGVIIGNSFIKPLVGERSTETTPQAGTSAETPSPNTSPKNTPSGKTGRKPQRNTPQSTPRSHARAPRNNGVSSLVRRSLRFPGGGMLILLIFMGAIMALAFPGSSSTPTTAPKTPIPSGSGSVVVSKVQRNCQKSNPSDDFCTVNNGEDITYDISVTYSGTGTANVIRVSDTIDKQTQFKDATEGGTADTNGVVTWVLRTLAPGQPRVISLTVHPSKDDVWIVNNTPTAAITSVSGISGGDILQCTFYGKTGDLKIGNPALASLINDVASKVGIPSTVLAGIIRIESQDAFKSTDATYLTNDFDDHPSPKGAIGIAQFLPSTFADVFNVNKSELASLFQKNSVDNTTQRSSDTSALRITSVRDSIIASAYYIRMLSKKAAWNEETVHQVAEGYHGACAYPDGGSYCDDLIKDFNTCQVTTPVVNSIVTNWVQSINDSSACVDNVIAGSVTKNDYPSCIPPLQPSVPQAVQSYWKTSTDKNTDLQCVGFVQGLLQQSLSTGNAAGLAVPNAVSGYSIFDKNSGKPQAGDLAVWTGGKEGNGHVAYVLGQVDSALFQVAEANYCARIDDLNKGCHGKVELRNVGYNDIGVDGLHLVGWLRKTQ